MDTTSKFTDVDMYGHLSVCCTSKLNPRYVVYAVYASLCYVINNSALSGLEGEGFPPVPGRCPGLSYFALSGQFLGESLTVFISM